MIKNENYIQISGWMVSELKLKGNELLIYAVIHGFSQDGKSDFHGGLSYLAEWTNSTKQGVIKSIKSLVEKGLVVKILEKTSKSAVFIRYFTTKSRINIEETDKERSTKFTAHNESGKQSLTRRSTEFNAAGKQSLPNNTLNSDLKNSSSAEETETENHNSEKQKPEEAEVLITRKITELFGGHFVFDDDFAAKISAALREFGVQKSLFEKYLDFAFERSKSKNPASLTNMFFKVAQSKNAVQDFLLANRKAEAEKQKTSYTAICPVCGHKNVGIYSECPSCAFNMNDREDIEKISLAKQIRNLPENTRKKFTEEYNAEIQRQISFGFKAFASPALQKEFKTKIAEICSKYGISA